jgi:hypothetical protein
MRTRGTLHAKRRPSPNPSDTSLESKRPTEPKTSDWNEQMLDPEYVPPLLVGRTEEKQVIYGFVRDAVMNRMNCKVLCK